MHPSAAVLKSKVWWFWPTAPLQRRGAVEALHNLEFSIILSPRQQRPRGYQLPRYSKPNRLFFSSCCLGRSVQAHQVNLIYFESLQAINRRLHPIVSDKLRVLLTVWSLIIQTPTPLHLCPCRLCGRVQHCICVKSQPISACQRGFKSDT